MAERFEYNDNSLQGHGISRIEALQVVESLESEYFQLSRNQGADRLMFVGYSQISIGLLEVGVEFLPDGRERIFHANKARKFFIQLYRIRKRI